MEDARRAKNDLMVSAKIALDAIPGPDMPTLRSLFVGTAAPSVQFKVISVSRPGVSASGGNPLQRAYEVVLFFVLGKVMSKPRSTHWNTAEDDEATGDGRIELGVMMSSPPPSPSVWLDPYRMTWMLISCDCNSMRWRAC